MRHFLAAGLPAIGTVLLGCSGVQAPSGPGADETPPTVTLTSPGNNEVLSGVVTLTATASDDRGIAGVTFKIDGVDLGSEDTQAPYTYIWNTLQGDNATHVIAAGARDLEGNGTTSAGVTVTVVNPTTGSMRVTVSTLGADFDPDGYVVLIGTRSVVLGVNQALEVSDLPRGPTTVQLGGVAPNCTLIGYAQVSSVINIEGMATVSYQLVCSSLTLPAERIVWRHRSAADAPDGALFSINGDGTGKQLFLATDESNPEWNSSHNTVYYRSDQSQAPGVWSFRPTGSVETYLVPGARNGDPTASPAGIIAYAIDDNQVAVGVGGTQLLGDGNKPAWAPSTDSIVFVRAGDIWISSPTGANSRRLIAGGSSPHWSPNGSKILFWRDQGGGVGSYWIANADGTGATLVVQGSFLPDAGSSWSPNGRQFVYSSNAGGESNLWVANIDGTGAVNITNGTGETNIQPTWFR